VSDYFWTLQRLQGLVEIVLLDNPWVSVLAIDRNRAQGFDISLCFMWNQWDHGLVAIRRDALVIGGLLLARTYSDTRVKDILIERVRFKRRVLERVLREELALAAQLVPEPGD